MSSVLFQPRLCCHVTFVCACGLLLRLTPGVSQAAHLDQFDRLVFITGSTLGTLLLIGILHAFAPQLLACLLRAKRALRICRCHRESIVTPPGTVPLAGQPVTSPPTPSGVVVFRTWATKVALAVMFLVYAEVSTEIVKSFR